MDAQQRRVERRSRTVGTLPVRRAPTLPGRALTAASTVARSVSPDRLRFLLHEASLIGLDSIDGRYLPRPRPRLA
jgi:hypothetical protein